MPRDFSKPYTEEELEGLKVMFQNLPSYKPGGWINAADIPVLIERMEYPRTPEQIRTYQEYWETNFGGIMTMEGFLNFASMIHDTTEFARDYALKFDTKGDGFFSKEGFEALLEMLVTHEPKLEGITFEDFSGEAGTDRNGKVSIDNCTEWIKKHVDAKKLS